MADIKRIKIDDESSESSLEMLKAAIEGSKYADTPIPESVAKSIGIDGIAATLGDIANQATDKQQIEDAIGFLKWNGVKIPDPHELVSRATPSRGGAVTPPQGVGMAGQGGTPSGGSGGKQPKNTPTPPSPSKGKPPSNYTPPNRGGRTVCSNSPAELREHGRKR